MENPPSIITISWQENSGEDFYLGSGNEREILLDKSTYLKKKTACRMVRNSNFIHPSLTSRKTQVNSI